MGRLILGLVAGFAVGIGMAVGVTLATTAEAPLAALEPAADTTHADAGVACVSAALEERAAQTLLVGLPHVTAPEDPLVAEVLDVGVGGVLLTKTNVDDRWQVRALIRALRLGSARPLLIATDEEPGRVSSFGGLLGRTSSARTLAARGEPAEVRQFARELGAQLAALGVDIDLAPVVDVDDGPARGVIGDRAFSGDPEVVAEYGLAFSAGLADSGVLPTAKHFPGHGRSAVDSHRRLAVVDTPLHELAAADLVPFVAQIEAGVPLVMVNHVAYDALDPELPASLAAPTYALLRSLGFHGVAITDSTGMGAVHQTWDFATSAVMAIRAGADAVVTTDGAQARGMRDALVAAVTAGELDEARLDEAAGRVLALKGEDPRSVVCRDVPPIPQVRAGPSLPSPSTMPR